MNTDWREQRRQERWARHQARRERRQFGPHHNPFGGAILGLLLIGAGGLFLLRNMGIFYVDDLWNYLWPGMMIAFGLSFFVTSRGSFNIIPGAVLTVIGSSFLLRNLGYIHGNVGGFIWPGILIAVGGSMLMRHLYGPDWFGGGSEPVGVNASSAGLSDASASDAKKIQADVIFGGINRKFVSQSFEGGRISVVFAGADIDLRGANTQQAEVVINADAVFGGVDLKVPDTWLVDVRGSGVFGSYEDMTHHPAQTGPNPPPRLVVKGGAVFGGVTVRN